MGSDDLLRDLILGHVPGDGGTVGNIRMMKLLADAADFPVSEDDYRRVRDDMIARGILVSGGGRGGSIKRAEPAPAGDSEAETVEAAPVDSAENRLTLQKESASAPKPAGQARTSVVSRSRSLKGEPHQIISYRYSNKRKNNPHVGMVNTASDGVEERIEWGYDPHIDPALEFDIGRASIETLIDDALASKDESVMREALEQLKRMQAPYLNWTGKAERTSFEVDMVSLHVHERIDPATILSAVQKRIRGGRSKRRAPQLQTELFSAPFENMPLREAIDFYKHDRDWANRLVAGDSLLVMNSLLQKENMAGQVQMIYIDPPYGIKYGSNFQPFVNKRDVKDRKDEDLTQEPEMIKAFRDTWELGIHSYLTYLRDWLWLAKELLHESGSVFVQISDENLHHVREIMDEIFGATNHVALLIYKKTTTASSDRIAGICDYLVWYCKNIKQLKYRQLFFTKEIGGPGATQYTWVRYENGVRLDAGSNAENELKKGAIAFSHDNITSQRPAQGEDVNEFAYLGRKFTPGKGTFKTDQRGLCRLMSSGRLLALGDTLRYTRYLNDFPASPVTHLWDDTVTSGFSDKKVYVVQTSPIALERCLLMTTDPGDLVLDPTCGSGTTAFVAEKWGRRWITCDTSRVATVLTRQRLMTASYDYYELKYPHEGLKGGFIYKTVPHITLKSIANNPEIDVFYDRMYPAIERHLTELNAALAGHGEPFKITEGGRKGKTIDFAAPAGKTDQLPSGKAAPANALLEWEVPFDFPEDWPEIARTPFDDFHSSRQAMQKKMDESISAHADSEILYDQPQVSKTKLRITGPFTVEAVPFPTVLALDEAEAPANADVAVARSGETSRQAQWRDELLKTGIRGKGGQKLKLIDLEPLPDCRYIHAVGTTAESGERVAVSFGPEHAALEQRQVEIAKNEAGDLFPTPKMLVFCAFTFDPEAAKDIDNIKGIAALKVLMNTDLLTEDLKKGRANNESFWLMGQPDVEIIRNGGGQYQVEVHGFDYFDTKTGELQSGGKNKIAVWALDTDYDDRSLFPRQVFFPMAGAKDGWNRLKKDIRAELNESLLEQFHGTRSLPFEAGDNRRIAVKIIDDRGIESLKVMDLD